MIELFEQHCSMITDSIVTGKSYEDLTVSCRNRLNSQQIYKRTVKRKGKDQLCFHINYDTDKNDYFFQTSYFIGVDWVDFNQQLKIYIAPKLNNNNDNSETDYIQILLEALEEPENYNHLDGLLHIDFTKPFIEIEQKQDLLSPFLIAQFLQILKRIVQKGLKKSYYTVTENLNSRIKGKILVSKNIKENLSKGRQTHTVCQYQEFGVNCIENKILKKAYQFSRRAIQQYKQGIDTKPLLSLIDYIHPTFECVSDHIDVSKVKTFKSNPLFKEYDQAIKLALLILKRYSYNITKTGEQKISTPPFWIDMSKLFELYVYKKLREVFKQAREVQHHVKANYQELDFIIKSSDEKHLFIIDTKYKPRYHDEPISIKDIRQISGYARLKKVYQELGLSDYDKNINCLIIYTHQECDESFSLEHFTYKEDSGEVNKIRSINNYINLYKLGIRLPVINAN